MNDNTILKVRCEVCKYMVVPLGHAERCRVRSAKGWSSKRMRAWVGDTVHRVDVQIALQLMEVEPTTWEANAQAFTSNVAQAVYMRALTSEMEGRSDHTAGTEFESLYEGEFRITYLKNVFPTVHEAIVRAWQPPPLLFSTLADVASSSAGVGN